MAQIGCLGDVAFVVSSTTIKTLVGLKWSGSARYAVHQRYGQNALTEYVGLDPDRITFDLTLSSYLGADPMAEMNRLWEYERAGTPVGFVLGDKAYGKYKWNLVSHEAKATAYDGRGNIAALSVTVVLQEYLSK